MGLRSAMGMASMVVALGAAPVLALEPLRTFIAAAERHSSGSQEQQALAEQARAELNAVRYRFLPAVRVELGYVRNQQEVSAIFPTGTATPGGGATVGTTDATFVARHQLQADIEVRMPLFDVSLLRQREAVAKRRRAAEHQVQASDRAVGQSVARAYFEYIAASAMVDAAKSAEKVATVDQALMQVRVEAGTVPELDGKRAQAELLSRRRAVADAVMVQRETARALRTLSGLQPGGELPALEAAPPPEAPLASWLRDAEQTPAVQAARQSLGAAESAAAPLWYVVLPRLEGRFDERLTNAPGFLPTSFWSVGAFAIWNLDMARFPELRASAAGSAAARARFEATRDASRDGIEQAWQQVETLQVRVQATQAQAASSALAQEIAQADFKAGRIPALRLIEASRDAFAAEVERLRALAELHMWRALLRIRSGRGHEVGA